MLDYILADLVGHLFQDSVMEDFSVMAEAYSSEDLEVLSFSSSL